ncbi:MAG: Glu-tRNA(Gln) amidotransferase GatDE subunit D [Nitrososphaerota archaeon]
MEQDPLQGYTGEARSYLERRGVKVGDLLRLRFRGAEIKGTLMPRYGLYAEAKLVIKLPNGYNVGIDLASIEGLEKAGEARAPSFIPPPSPSPPPSLPRVRLIGTGGTIASRIDYETGAVHAFLDASSLYSSYPELASVALLEPVQLFNLYSEDIGPGHWSRMAEEIWRGGEEAQGFVVAHGTDTMGYTAAALSFSLRHLDRPVVLVGAQRSSDRPSSDSFTNLLAAIRFAAQAPCAGVFVAMHESPSDQRIAVHLGTRVRKCHTSRRDAFRSISIPPVGYVEGDRIALRPGLRARGEGKGGGLLNKFEERVALLKFYPGMRPEQLLWLKEAGYRGVVLEGTGLGHVAHHLIPALRELRERGLLVGMTSQTIWGSLRMTVYETGRRLLEAGVVPLNMIPETALVKMMWALGNAGSREGALELLMEPIAGEFLEREVAGGHGSGSE